MDLGDATLRRTGVNILQSALSKRHGLAWPSSEGVFITSVAVQEGQINTTSTNTRLLLKLKNVRSLHWSPQAPEEFLACCHGDGVTVISVDTDRPEETASHLSHIPPQACFWHPSLKVLCQFTQQEIVIHRLTGGTPSDVKINITGKKLGCWVGNGNQLLVCVSEQVKLVTWLNLEELAVFDMVDLNIKGLQGTITALIPGPDGLVLCTTTPSVGDVCKQSGSWLTSPGTVPSQQGSALESLLNLQKRDQTAGLSARLAVLNFQNGCQAVVTCCVQLNGVISPDLLCYENQQITVGSNTQRTLQVFAHRRNTLVQSQNITLEEDERPKGLCGYPDTGGREPGPQTGPQAGLQTGLLVVTGKSKSVDPAFLFSSTHTSYRLTLKYFPLRSDVSELFQRETTELPVSLEPVLQMDEPNMALRLPDTVNCGRKVSLIQDLSLGTDVTDTPLEVEQVDFESVKCKFDNNDSIQSFLNKENFPTNHSSRMVAMNQDKIERLNSETSYQHRTFSVVSEKLTCADSMEKQDTIKDRSGNDVITQHAPEEITQNAKIKATCNAQASPSDIESTVHQIATSVKTLRVQVEELSRNHRLKHHKTYPNMEEAGVVTVRLLTGEPPGVKTVNKFLLDRGRLKLNVLRTAFNITSVQIIINGSPCFVDCDEDGYIPLTFTANSVIDITGS